jgi:diguanylate cyclase (GGDEF)-like protein
MTNDHYLDNIDEFLETVHFDDVSVVEDFIKNLYDAKKHKACEFRLKCKGQVYSWFRLEASTICDSEGRPIRLAGTFTNVEKRKIYETEQKLQEEKDTLTGVLKKQVFEESVTSILKKTNHEQTFGIYLIDLDNFKEINDRMGHEFGDRILVETARKISVVFSDRDYIGRLGGDDFIAFLNLAPYTSKEDAMQIIKNKGENICRILKNAYTVKGGEHSISASVGISVYKTDGESYDELFKKAKTALLTAKKNGKDKYFIYNKDICGGEY